MVNMQSYASLQEGGEQEESGVLIHVVESSRARWNHVEDLDSFFSRMYRYHQRHGFICILLEETLNLCQFLFVVYFTTNLFYCVDYPLLFRDKPLPNNSAKVTLRDVIIPMGECSKNFNVITYIALFVAAVIWLLRLIRSVYHIIHFWDIKQFFNSALGVADSELSNLTWNEVQTKVRAVQLEQQMCIHKRELSELDIYHRILRQQNYLVAMANKRLLPPRLQVPLLGETIYWTRGLKYNIQLLLFWGPWSPFQNPWHLREEYRKPNLRHELARELGNRILWLAFANLLLAPLILLWQIIYAFFGYTEEIKREPHVLAIRRWSMYARLYLRHFNELDHELQARLNRANRLTTRYLSAFTSPATAIIARHVAFVTGAIMGVFVVLTFYDEDVLTVEHVLFVMGLVGVCYAIAHALLPDDTLAWCPETLLKNVLAHTHYLPVGWQGQAHTTRIRAEVQQLYQYRVVALFEELISPILTPYILWRHVYPRALDIVDFYRNFTVSVVGVGDVCSFAQLDVRRHGNPEWQGVEVQTAAPNQYTQAEDGKTELSLMHFTLQNPSWRPPPDAQHFVEAVQRESCIVPQTSGDYMLQADLTDSSLHGMCRNEATANSNTNNMSVSTLFLHDRHFRNVGHSYQKPPEETTPLLSTN